MVKIKICGLTNIDDALAAAALGADALGFVLAPSPRRITPDTVRKITAALPPLVLTVGVFVDLEADEIKDLRDYCRLDAVQLQGSETEETAAQIGGRVIKALKVGGPGGFNTEAYPTAALLLDTYSPVQAGGTGKTFDWKLAAGPAQTRPIILAGGLTPENVAEAITTVGPYAVDVSSGVESAPGRKDHDKIERFIRRARTLG